MESESESASKKGGEVEFQTTELSLSVSHFPSDGSLPFSSLLPLSLSFPVSLSLAMGLDGIDPLFVVEGVAPVVFEDTLFARPLNSDYCNRWIGYSCNFLMGYRILAKNQKPIAFRAYTWPASQQPTTQECVDVVWNKEAPTDKMLYHHYEITPPGWEGFDSTDERLVSEMGALCMTNHHVWNAFRIDAATGVVTLALDYMRTVCCTVSLDDFIARKMWLSSWQQVKGLACKSMNLIRAEDNPEMPLSNHYPSKYIHNGVVYQMDWLTADRTRTTNSSVEPVPTGAVPKAEEQVWLPMSTVILQMRYEHRGLYTVIRHVDGNPLNNVKTNLTSQPNDEPTDSVVLVQGKKPRYLCRLRPTNTERIFCFTPTVLWSRENAQSMALRFVNTPPHALAVFSYTVEERRSIVENARTGRRAVVTPFARYGSRD